ncbi:hypothetical protein RJT34_31469 [Clitoria ternatea]|uniref:Secreted protein n=1 Tax=Clitoria ternatea TaxID=43366 RepID=A0AAN9EV37_CLITE
MICVLLFLCLLRFNGGGNNNGNLVAADTDEMVGGGSRRLLLGREQRAPCKRGRVTVDVGEQVHRSQPRDQPRCHNYL